MTAARELFAEHGVSGVTTQQIASRADVAIGTLYRYASTKAELLIMVQNEKFAAAIDDGLDAANAAAGQGALEAGQPEAVVDEFSRDVKAALHDDLNLLYPALEAQFAAEAAN